MTVKTIEPVIEKEQKQIERIIGRYGGTSVGPTVVALGGLHGNEPSGVYALEMLFAELKELQPDFTGSFVGIAGNLKALNNQLRYIDRDLNRMWRVDMAKEEVEDPGQSAERDEFDALSRIVETLISESKGPMIFIDLHSTSAPSIPFALIGDTLRNRRFVSGFPVPIILGLEEQLNGPLLSFMNMKGHISMGFEGGQHDDPSSVTNHLAILRMTLVKAGCISAKAFPDYQKDLKKVGIITKGQKHNFEVRYRYGITPEEGFKMNPGYQNFQPIKKGELLAHDKMGEVQARIWGRVFMPLYQSQGDDGFFVIRRIAPFWLRISAGMRYMKLHNLLPYLPGIKKHPEVDSALIMETRVARFFGKQVFHLMGFRKIKREGSRLFMVKRKFDLKGPK